MWGLGLGVEGLGFRVKGVGFGVKGVGYRVWSLGFGVWGLGCRHLDSFVGVRHVGRETLVLVWVQGLKVWG